MGWSIFAASAVGASHVAGGLPCQDAFAHARCGDWFAGVVCDGAGSAPRSDEGARRIAEQVVGILAGPEVRAEALATLDAAGFKTRVTHALETARSDLAAFAEAERAPLKAFAATVVGALVGPEGGWLFHIGDGIGVARLADADRISAPANGEYANQTFFLTQKDWREQLRITPVGAPVRSILLMSDGAMSFVMGPGGRSVYAPFFDPVDRFLADQDEATGSEALAATLADARTEHITGDDKTLLIARRA